MWVFFGLSSAFFVATYNALLKRLFLFYDEYLITFIGLGFTSLLLFLLLPFVKFYELSFAFFKTLSFCLPLELGAIILYIKALKLSPLSLTLPFLSLTPLYLILTSFFILGERIGLKGIFGILFLAAGSYVLNFDRVGKGILSPFSAIMKERGSLYMIAVSFLYSLTSALGKKAILLSSPITFAFFYYVLLWFSFGIVVFLGKKEKLRSIRKKDIFKSFPVGLSNFLSILCHVFGISLSPVAYFIALKRISIFFGLLYGFLLFKEGGARQRTTGTILMFVGFLILIF